MDVNLGALKDIEDSRDYVFKDTRISKIAKATAYMPDYVDWSMYSPPVKDQKYIGSCVAQACASAREFLVRTLDPNSQAQYSPLFIYLKARQAMGTFPADSGLYTRSALKALQTFGVPEEISWPYDTDKFNDEPDAQTYESASWKKIYAYHRLETNTVEEMEQCISQQRTFILSMQVFGNLLVLRTDAQGVVIMPTPDDTLVGGHAVFVIGMSRSNKLFHCQNSWSKNYGISGRFWLPYEYVSRYVMDCWSIIG